MALFLYKAKGGYSISCCFFFLHDFTPHRFAETAKILEDFIQEEKRNVYDHDAG